MARRQRVAILGGGAGGIAAAWALSTGRNAGRFDITVYEADCRLGGKCASHTADGPQDHRIEEHGLHVLMGFYDHGIGWLREIYEAAAKSSFAQNLLGPDETLRPIDSATICAPDGAGGWSYWNFDFPTNDRVPGIDRPGHESLIHGLLTSFVGFYRLFARRRGSWFRHLILRVVEFLLGFAVVLALVLSLLHRFGLLDAIARWIVRRVRAEARHVVGASGAEDSALRRDAMLFAVAAANLAGIIKDRLFLPPHDFASIDHLDYKDWLRRHDLGDWPADLSWDSSIVNGLYELPFSHGRTMGAGTTLHVVLRMGLGYAGHVAYDMNLGMGDLFFAPAYLLLNEQGVDFRFHNRITDIRADDSGRWIEEVLIDAPLGMPEEPPLRPVPMGFGDGLADPTREIWSWGPEGRGSKETGSITLRRGKDFDVVVLGISVGALGPLTRTLQEAHAPFAQMVDGLATRGTQAVQLWFDGTREELGMRAGTGMGLSFVRPFNSWADKSYMIPLEGWQAPVPGTLLYAANELDADDLSAEEADELVRRNLSAFAQRETLSQLLADYQGPASLRAPAGTTGEERIDAQYWRASTIGSERYVLVEAGTSCFRLAPGDSGFVNLALAGDWTRTSMNSGCVEAAIEAGFEAAQTISTGVVRPPESNPPYVPLGGDWVWPPPGIMNDTQMCGLLCEADVSAIEALCRRLVDGPSGGAVTARPLLGSVGLVLVVTASIATGGSSAPGYAQRGRLSENDLAFFVPVSVTSSAGSWNAVLVPYVYVDSDPGLVMGREIFGFPKVMADFRLDWDAFRFEVDSLAIRHYGQDEMASKRRIADIRCSDPARAVKRRMEGDDALLELMVAALGEFSPGPRPIVGIADIPLLFLKQFRSGVDQFGACHQSLMSVDAPITRIGSARLLDHRRFSIELPEYDSLRLAGTLGLGAGPIQPKGAVAVDMSFTIPTGKVLWKALETGS